MSHEKNKLLDVKKAGPFRAVWENGQGWIVSRHGRKVLMVAQDGLFVNYPGERDRVAEDVVALLNAAQKGQEGGES